MKGAIPLSANTSGGGLQRKLGGGAKEKGEENRMHQQNKNIQREWEEKWNVIGFMQPCDWYSFGLLKTFDASLD